MPAMFVDVALLPVANARGRFKGEGEFNPPIALPNAPAFGSGDGGLGSLFALNPDARGEGPKG